MITNIDKLTEHGCKTEKSDKVCRSRGGESCAFDGAMIVLQPIADTAHIVHGPIACCGNSWEGRGALSSKGALHRMGFTTDINEMDIIYGSEEKLYQAILKTNESVQPKAIFVYGTCVSGLIGEDIDAVCQKAGTALGIPVIPVNAPGFVGPKNLGNRIAGEVLLYHVIGTGEPSVTTDCDINLIGEYNIAGDLWLIEPVLKKAGLRILSRITGDARFEEITWAHRAKLNVIVCSRALINVAREMVRKYGIPYIEVSFFGRTEIAKALRAISCQLSADNPQLQDRIEEIIAIEEQKLHDKLRPYEHLRGKKAVLYTGGVKSWSFISALLDLGIEVVAVGTKKSTFEDEEKMKEILGQDALLVEDVTPKNLLCLLREKNADILVAGGRNQYLAIKEGYPFVDVNQERHTAYAGYEGLVNLAEQISNSIRFYKGIRDWGLGVGNISNPKTLTPKPLLINPLKHSQALGAAMAFQGVHNALPVIHGAQGCTFLGKALLTKHFREPIALAGTKLFAEDVVMGSDEALTKTVRGFIEKNSPEVIGVLTSGLTEVKGDDVSAVVKSLNVHSSQCRVIHIPTPDYEGGLESGYAKAVESLVGLADTYSGVPNAQCNKGQITILAGSHLTPADFLELREIVESFGLCPVIIPDLSSLDGSRQVISPLATGGTNIQEIYSICLSEYTIVIGMGLELAAQRIKNLFGIEYRVFEGLSGLGDTDLFMETLRMLSSRSAPLRYGRQRRILIDGMRDAHFFFGKKKVCIALEPDHALQISRLLTSMGACIPLAVVPAYSAAARFINAESVSVGDLFSIKGDYDLIISNSHATDIAAKLGIPLMQAGFPVYKILGNTSKITIGYRGSLNLVHEIANILNGNER